MNDPHLTEYRRVLVELLPALVHRSSNALTTISAVLDLGDDATGTERDLAREQTGDLIRTLRRLGELVPRDEEPARPVDLATWVADLAPILRTIAEVRRSALELLVPGAGLAIPMDARLERRLAATLIATLLRLDRELPPQRVRVTARRDGHSVVVSIVLRGGGSSPHVESLAALPGVQARVRELRGVHATRVTLRALEGDGPRAVADRQRVPRLLVLENERTPELEELLSQHGYRPLSVSAIPPDGAFDLVLVDEDWARSTGDWLERITATPSLARVPIVCLGECPAGASHPRLPRPVSPGALLAELARRV